MFPPVKPEQNTQQTANTTHPTPTADSSSNVNAPSTSTAAASAPVQVASSGLVTVKSDNFIITLDEFGRISQFELLEEKYHDENGDTLKILGASQVKPLEVRFSDVKLNEEAFKTPYVNNTGSSTVDVSKGAQTVTLTQTLSSVT